MAACETEEDRKCRTDYLEHSFGYPIVVILGGVYRITLPAAHDCGDLRLLIDRVASSGCYSEHNVNLIDRRNNRRNCQKRKAGFKIKSQNIHFILENISILIK